MLDMEMQRMERVREQSVRAFNLAFAMVLFPCNPFSAHVATKHPNSSRCLPEAARRPVHYRGENGPEHAFRKVASALAG